MNSICHRSHSSQCHRSRTLLGALLALSWTLLLLVVPVGADEETHAVEQGALEWVEVSGIDRARLDEAIEVLVETFSSDSAPTQFFILVVGERVAVFGADHPRRIATELISRMPKSPEIEETVVVRLKQAPNTRGYERIEAGEGYADMTRRGTELTITGTRPEIDNTLAHLEEEGALGDPMTPWCETVRLYYLRNPSSVQTILAQMPAGIIGEVVAIAGDTSGGPPTVVLAGPKAQVANVKRIIATLDVPQPEVRLDIWAFQISGDKPADVEQRARTAQQRIDAISRLMRGYLRQIEGHAQRIQMDSLRSITSAYEREVEASVERISPVQSIPTLGGTGSGIVMTPSARGPHPFSLTETLATLITAPVGTTLPSMLSAERDSAAGGELPAVPPDEIVGPTVQAQFDESSDTKSTLSQAMLTPNAFGQAVSMKTGDSRLLTLTKGLGGPLRRWLADLAEADPEALRIWAELVAADPDATPELQELLARSSQANDGQRRRRPSSDASALLPVRLLGTFRDEDYSATAEAVIANFLWMHSELAGNWDAAVPEHIRMRASDAKTVLETAERALGDDIRRLFLRPLQNDLRNLASAGGESGLGSTGSTSIAVLSGTEAEVIGSAVSYFNISRPKQLDAEALRRSESFSRALEGFMPERRARTPSRVVIRVTLDRGGPDVDEWVARLETTLPGLQCWSVANASPPAMMLIGTRAQVSSAVDVLRTGGVVVGVQAAGAAEAAPVLAESAAELAASGALETLTGLPTDRLLALALDLGQEEEVWTALTNGARLTFTPHILPGGSAAELAINFELTHNDPGSDTAATMNAPLSRVARHSARTSVYVQALDLFSLSSLTLSTSHPRPDASIPVLGQIPLLGQMFRFPRSPARVYHESVLMVYSTILPTGADLAATLDVGARED